VCGAMEEEDKNNKNGRSNMTNNIKSNDKR
jgi:hypothetical protein